MICFVCKSQFECGMQADLGDCWCGDRPTLNIDLKNPNDCLCPNCFDLELAKKSIFKKRWRLWIAYDGSAFHGFVNQKNLVTVESAITQAIFEITGQKILLQVAGRTDSGVHAKKQCASFTAYSRLDEKQIVLALQTKLPKAVSILRADVVPLDFNSRRHAVGKRYIYRIATNLGVEPYLVGRVWHLRKDLSLEKMKEGAAFLVGEHDFEAFRSASCGAAHAKRYIWQINICESDGLFCFDIRGNAFCHNMIRIIIGTLVEVGRGKSAPGEIKIILDNKDRSAAGQTAPARGLTLDEIYYPDYLLHANIPVNAVFPRYPISVATWPYTSKDIIIGPTR